MQFAAAPWRLGFSRPAASSLQEEQGPDVSRQLGKKGAALARCPKHPCTSPGARVQEVAAPTRALHPGAAASPGCGQHPQPALISFFFFPYFLISPSPSAHAHFPSLCPSKPCPAEPWHPPCFVHTGLCPQSVPWDTRNEGVGVGCDIQRP